MDALIADDCKFPVPDCKIDHYSVPLLGFRHSQFFKNVRSPVKDISFANTFNMNPDLARRIQLGIHNRLLDIILLFP
jgi:hypothetical protein